MSMLRVARTPTVAEDQMNRRNELRSSRRRLTEKFKQGKYGLALFAVVAVTLVAIIPAAGFGFLQRFPSALP